MGFDSIIAAGISLILLIVVSYVLFSGFFASMDSMTATMKSTMNSKDEQIRTNITVDYDYVHTYGRNITMDWYNHGNTKILDLSGVDMIMTFSETLNNSTETTYWIPYVKDVNATNLGWTAEEITPDMINPGIWDPGEQIKCRVTLPDHPLTGTLGWLVVTAPNGASTSGYFHVIQESPP